MYRNPNVNYIVYSDNTYLYALTILLFAIIGLKKADMFRCTADVTNVCPRREVGGMLLLGS